MGRGEGEGFSSVKSEVQLDLLSPTILQQFEAWADSPGGRQVLRIAYAITARFARRYRRNGRRVSMKFIWETLRDNITFIRARMLAKGIMLDRIEGFALNNNFHAHVARHILAHKPEWASLFELRELGQHRNSSQKATKETKGRCRSGGSGPSSFTSVNSELSFSR
jgi:hypothetical protein